jgi:cephalosporin hydroxylase
MAQTYRIEAHSVSLNQTIQQVDLINQIDEQMTYAQAQQLADAFARVKNSNFDMHVSDWQGRATPQEVGLHTIAGYRA